MGWPSSTIILFLHHPTPNVASTFSSTVCRRPSPFNCCPLAQIQNERFGIGSTTRGSESSKQPEERKRKARAEIFFLALSILCFNSSAMNWGVRYHELESWKFGVPGNKYFCHATGQLYAISRDLATYISINQHLLHQYANENVSLRSWFIGVDVEHIDDMRLRCGTPLIVSGRLR